MKQSFKQFAQSRLRNRNWSTAELLKKYRAAGGRVGDKTAYAEAGAIRQKYTPKEKTYTKGMSYEEYVNKSLAKDPTQSATGLKRSYRYEGGQIGDKAARQVVNPKTIKRKKAEALTYSTNKGELKVRDDAPITLKSFTKGHYVYLMIFNVYSEADEDMSNPHQRLMYVGIPELDLDKAIEATFRYWRIEVGKGLDERYTEWVLDPDSIRVYRDEKGYAIYQRTE